jgi:UDP-N-acetylmuramoyl-tripeptide--D-alanyl-D-alanine ligase
MQDMTIKRAAKACGGELHFVQETTDTPLFGAAIDSRAVEPGNLFVAMKGEKTDGHKYIPSACERGAAAILCEEKPEHCSVPCIVVPSCFEALKQIAAEYRRTLDIPVIGIIGSVGKTSTKEMVAAVLSQKYHVLKTDGNYNNEIGVPLTLMRIRAEHEAAVVEMGISEFGEMTRLGAVAHPDICVMTNIGWCHTENLIDRSGILRAKTEVFATMRQGAPVILNGDDEYLNTITKERGVTPYFYRILQETPKENISDRKTDEGKKVDAYITASNVISHGFGGSDAVFNLEGESFGVHIPLPGEHMVYNALAAAAVGRLLDVTTTQIQEGILNAQTIGGRSNFIEHDGYTVIDDCYNANPVSMKASLEVLSYSKGRKIAVLGDMFELGSEEEALHARIGETAARLGIDALFCEGKLSKALVEAAAQEGMPYVAHYDDKSHLIAELKDYIRPGDTILVKASHGMHFTEIVQACTK